MITTKHQAAPAAGPSERPRVRCKRELGHASWESHLGGSGERNRNGGKGVAGFELRGIPLNVPGRSDGDVVRCERGVARLGHLEVHGEAVGRGKEEMNADANDVDRREDERGSWSVGRLRTPQPNLHNVISEAAEGSSKR